MGLNAIKCEGYSEVLERAGSHGMVSANDFALGESAKEKLMYAGALGALAAWAGYWIMSTPTYSEMCGHANNDNQSNATGNATSHEDPRCEKDDDGIALPPLLYVHYP